MWNNLEYSKCKPSLSFLSEIKGDVDRIFGADYASDFHPALDVSEDEKNYIVKADLPGVKKEDVEISVAENVLSLKGERKEENSQKDKNYYHFERRFGTFQRFLKLPAQTDASQIKAVYKDGVLEISIPKPEEVKPKQIKIDVA